MFDYECSLTTGNGSAHAIFAWDCLAQVYRLWWFEDSGNFEMATGQFEDEDTLVLTWQSSQLMQTFHRLDADRVLLKMENPSVDYDNELIMEVLLTRPM